MTLSPQNYEGPRGDVGILASPHLDLTLPGGSDLALIQVDHVILRLGLTTRSGSGGGG